MIIVTRKMCGMCQELKEIMDSQDIEYSTLDAKTVDGLIALARYFDGPDTALPSVICEDQDEYDLVSQYYDGNICIRRTW